MPDTPDGRVTLAVIQSDIKHLTQEVQAGFAQTNEQLRALNGTVRQHETRLSLLESFCDEQVKPIIKTVNENRLELVKLGAFGGGLGGVLAIVVAVGKVLGWW
jgi:hypothetical protein